jgi:transcriptional regulator with XRE-family HTH domain
LTDRSVTDASASALPSGTEASSDANPSSESASSESASEERPSEERPPASGSSDGDAPREDVSRERLRRFGAAIRAARQREGLTQADLAKKAGISRPYMSSIEQGGAAQLSLRVAWALCDALGLRAPVDLGVTPVAVENSDPAEPGVPPSLEAFAEAEGLGPADIQMLAGITYRGRQPTEPWQWRVIHRVIAASLEENPSAENRSSESHSSES